MEVIVFKRFLLPSGSIEVLPEISLLIEQTDGDERQGQIARRLQVIAGKNTQPAGENRQAFRNSKFSRKICHQHIVFAVVLATVP